MLAMPEMGVVCGPLSLISLLPSFEVTREGLERSAINIEIVTIMLLVIYKKHWVFYPLFRSPCPRTDPRWLPFVLMAPPGFYRDEEAQLCPSACAKKAGSLSIHDNTRLRGEYL